jgi:pyruvate/2-oxoglutarate dehydrogenase complex dihydrolipoamide acyltransferase (E2) component
VIEQEPSTAQPEPSARTAKGTSERAELSKREQAAARRAAESKATIPHLYARRTIELAGDELTAGTVVHAAARALRAASALNGAYRDGALETHSRVNVGLTVDAGDGSLTPTLLDADTKSVEQIDAEIAELREAARAGSLAAPALAGGTFTVTETPPGADAISLPVVVGQAAPLVAAAPRRAVVAGADGKPTVGWTAELTLSCDARAVKPEQAAVFLSELAATIGDGGVGD